MVRDFALCPDCYESFLDYGFALRSPPIVRSGRVQHPLPRLRVCVSRGSRFVDARDDSVRELFRRVHAYCGSELSGGWRHLAGLYPSLVHSDPVNCDAASVVAWLRSISADDFVSFFHNFVCDTFVGWTERCCRVGFSSTWCYCGAQWVQNGCVAPPVAPPAAKAAPANLSPSRESLRIAKQSTGWARAAAINRGKPDIYV